MKKTFNQTMPCAVRLAALLLVPAVCVAFSGCSAVPGSSGTVSYTHLTLPTN